LTFLSSRFTLWRTWKCKWSVFSYWLHSSDCYKWNTTNADKLECKRWTWNLPL